MAKTATEEAEAKDAEANEESQEEQAPSPHEQALARREQLSGSIIDPARYRFDSRQIAAIKATVAKDCSDAELAMFLEVAGRYELDPFSKQIFAARIKGAIQIIVSRDGLLAHAHRQPDFRGIVGDVVHEHDEFEVLYENGKRSVRHRYTYRPADPAIDDDPSADGRGAIIGAWAEVQREGHEPTFYFAPLGEYDRGGDTPWKTHKSAMILKVAEQYALRKAYSVSGVVGEEEIDRQRAQANLTAVPETDYGWDDDPELAQELAEMVDRANQVKPGSYRPAKVKGLLGDGSREARERLREELQAFFAEHGTEPEAEAVEGEIVKENDNPEEG